MLEIPVTMLSKYETVGSLVAPPPSSSPSSASSSIVSSSSGTSSSALLHHHHHGNRAMGMTSPSMPPSGRRHIFIITGPAGCGKSSVASFLAKRLNLPYIEGDDFHPKSNIAKMANGVPLTDDDRWDWLETIRHQAVHELDGGAEGCVVTCSCLKRKYRDVIRLAAGTSPADSCGGDSGDGGVVVRFIYLRANKELLMRRVRLRKGHYMKDSMVASQFEALEEPDHTERDVISIDVSVPLESVQAATMAQVSRVMHGAA